MRAFTLNGYGLGGFTRQTPQGVAIAPAVQNQKSILPWIIGGGAVLVLGGLFFFMRRR